MQISRLADFEALGARSFVAQRSGHAEMESTDSGDGVAVGSCERGQKHWIYW